MMTTVNRPVTYRPGRAKRKAVNPSLPPADFQLFAKLCDEQGRTYGEMLTLLLHAYLRSQQPEEKTL
jgi:hypothetical protein